jgi:hypothetical protein
MCKRHNNLYKLLILKSLSGLKSTLNHPMRPQKTLYVGNHHPNEPNLCSKKTLAPLSSQQNATSTGSKSRSPEAEAVAERQIDNSKANRAKPAAGAGAWALTRKRNHPSPSPHAVWNGYVQYRRAGGRRTCSLRHDRVRPRGRVTGPSRTHEPDQTAGLVVGLVGRRCPLPTLLSRSLVSVFEGAGGRVASVLG